MNRKADYNEIAGYYDRGRTMSEANIDLWLELVQRKSGAGPGTRLLDAGCGTGRFAVPFAGKLHYRVTGCDASPEMLAKAREKDTRHLVTWDVRDAHDPGYPDGSFDIVFMSLVLHHCEDPIRVISEIYRVLVPGGMFLLRHAVYDDIKDDPLYRFFPETRGIDEARLIPLEAVSGFLTGAGFVYITTELITQKSHVNGAELVRKFEGKAFLHSR